MVSALYCTQYKGIINQFCYAFDSGEASALFNQYIYLCFRWIKRSPWPSLGVTVNLSCRWLFVMFFICSTVCYCCFERCDVNTIVVILVFVFCQITSSRPNPGMRGLWNIGNHIEVTATEFSPIGHHLEVTAPEFSLIDHHFEVTAPEFSLIGHHLEVTAPEFSVKESEKVSF